MRLKGQLPVVDRIHFTVHAVRVKSLHDTGGFAARPAEQIDDNWFIQLDPCLSR